MFRRFIQKTGVSIFAFSLLACGLSFPSMESAAAASPISTIDSSLSTYDKIVMNVDGKPFFFNGIQIRDDKIVQRFNYTDAQMKNVYQLAADNGFTVANSQIYWSMIQPDQAFPAIESTYISGGSNANTNFSTSNSMKAKYDSTDPSNQAISYFKFDFSGISGTSADASKIRIYVNSMDSGTANLHLYGLANNSWDAPTMTWNSGAPNHNGYNLTGTEGVDYFDLGVTPSYDPVNQVAAYDFDVTDFLNNYAYGHGKIASFILKTDTSNNVGVTIDGAAGTTLAPQLVISRADVWDYSWVDKVIGWSEGANLKLELMWFGSDTTKHTIDRRVPYYVIRNYEKMQTSDGQVLQEKIPGVPLPSNDFVYDFHMSKDDPNLRAQEYTALKNLFDHVAVYDSTHGNKKTVIGANIANEPGNQIRGHRSYSPYSQALWTSGGYTSENLFMWDSFNTWIQNLGAAVKQSDYPVWTRTNFHSEQFYFVYRNEDLKASGGTSYVDFVGFDPYIGTTDEGFRYGLGLWSDAEYYPYNYGRNLPMIMETSANRSNSDYLNLATLAGGSTYNLYNLMANDGNDMYNNGPDNVPVANNRNIDGIKKTNFWLRTIGYDLATKQPDAAGGSKLKFFNEHADAAANVTKKIRGIDVTYSTSNTGVGIAVEKSDSSMALASKTASAFTLKNLLSYGPVTMTTGYYDENDNWVSTGTKAFSTSGNDVVVDMNDYETVRVETARSLPELNTQYSINDDFSNSFAGWTTQGAVSIADKPGLLDKSLRIESASAYAEKTFTPLSGDLKLQFRVRRDAVSGGFRAPDVYDSLGNTAISMALDASGNMVYKDSNGVWKVLQSYSNRTWYQIDLDIHTNTDTFDLYINGVKKLEQELLETPVSDIAKVKFSAEEAASQANIDQVKVYQESVGNGNVVEDIKPDNYTILPGDTFNLKANFTNTSEVSVNDVQFSLHVPEGWKAESLDAVQNAPVQPGENVTETFSITVPQDQATNQVVAIKGTASYNNPDGAAEVPLQTFVRIDLPLAITALKLDDDSLNIGESTKLHVTVQNTGNQAATGSVEVTVPQNWMVDPFTQALSLEGGEEKTVDFDVQSPSYAMPSDTELQVTSYYQGKISDQASVFIHSNAMLHFEGETTPFTTSGVATRTFQDDNASGGSILVTASLTRTGDWVEYTIQVPVSGTYDVNYGYKTHKKSRGTVQLTIDGVIQGAPVDQLAGTEGVTETDLGEVTLSAGPHAFRFTVTGKNDASNSYYFTVDDIDLTLAQTEDNTAPTTEAAVTPNQPDGLNGWYEHEITITLDASDNPSSVAGTEYSLDGGGTWLAYSEPVRIAQDGIYTFSYRSTDQAGNQEEPKEIAFNLDATAPEITVTGDVYSGTYDDSMNITPVFTLQDDLSGVDNTNTTVTLDGESMQQGPISLYTLPLGPHTLVVRASDMAGNESSQTIIFQTSTSIQSLQELVTLFTESGWIDNKGIANSLQSKLDADNLASFVSELQAQSGKHIAEPSANYLVRDAEYLMTVGKK